MIIMYHYHVSYHFTKHGQNGYGSSSVTSTQINTPADVEMARQRIMQEQKLDGLVIIAISKLGGN